jgi:hypothetical protein
MGTFIDINPSENESEVEAVKNVLSVAAVGQTFHNWLSKGETVIMTDATTKPDNGVLLLTNKRFVYNKIGFLNAMKIVNNKTVALDYFVEGKEPDFETPLSGIKEISGSLFGKVVVHASTGQKFQASNVKLADLKGVINTQKSMNLVNDEMCSIVGNTVIFK